MFTRAIVRPPGANFAEGLTTSGLGAPDHGLAVRQHEAYCSALAACGLDLIRLAPDERFPDSTFVEDTAVLSGDLAVLARPGAPSRSGEVEAIAPAVARFFPRPQQIEPPGTLDGGDICEAGGHFFIGISHRTNPEGASQLAGILARAGRTAAFVDIRGVPGILHLKSGVAWLGGKRLAVIAALAGERAFVDFERVGVDHEEAYAANCILVNGRLLLPAGYPRLASRLRGLGLQVTELDMSEYRKMDGGLSCLSLRF